MGFQFVDKVDSIDQPDMILPFFMGKTKIDRVKEFRYALTQVRTAIGIFLNNKLVGTVLDASVNSTRVALGADNLIGGVPPENSVLVCSKVLRHQFVFQDEDWGQKCEGIYASSDVRLDNKIIMLKKQEPGSLFQYSRRVMQKDEYDNDRFWFGIEIAVKITVEAMGGIVFEAKPRELPFARLNGKLT